MPDGPRDPPQDAGEILPEIGDHRNDAAQLDRGGD